MPECSCIELLERIVSQGGMLSEHDLNDAWAILKANGSELTRDPEERVSGLLCMSNLAHASPTKEHDNDDDFQGSFR
jgi:hypothetical protein